MEGTEIRWDETQHVLHALLAERIDATSRQELEEKLAKALEGRENVSILIDADKLNYISSAGIRVLVNLRKVSRDMRIFRVSQEIYDTLVVTGITDMIPVERRIREINAPSGELLIRKEADGDIYRWEEDQVVKIYHADVSFEEVQQIYLLTSNVASYGVPTISAYEIVSCGGKTGMIYEYPYGKTLAELWLMRPDRMQEEIEMLAELMHMLHHCVIEAGELPDAAERMLSELGENSTLSEDQRKKLTEMAENRSDGDAFVYGNLRLENIMLDDDRLVLLDMSRCGRGNAILDLQAAVSAMNADGHGAFWREFFARYEEFMDPEERAATERILDSSIKPWWKRF